MNRGHGGVRTTQRSLLSDWLVVLASVVLFPVLTSAQAWIQLLPTGGPPLARISASVAYIPSANRLLIFGGYPVYSVDPRPTNDLWALDGANGSGTAQWTQLIPADAIGSPQRRTWAPAFYDQSSNRMILFGGAAPLLSYQGLNDVWILTNADGKTGTPTWQQLTVSGPAPLPRSDHSAAYDPNTNRLIVYGGDESLNGSGGCPCNIYNDTWVLTNANGTGSQPPAWSQLNPTGTIPTLSHAAFAYDPAQNKLIVFGGYDKGVNTNGLGPATANTVTWVLSNANGLGGTPAWSQLATAGTPQYTVGTTAGYDPATQRFFIFGGDIPPTETQVTNAVYVLTNATGNGPSTWQPVNASGAPPARREAAGAYDTAHNEFLIFAGDEGAETVALNDFWVLTNANGIVTSQLGVTQILPNHGGNTGSVTTEVLGSAFQNGATVKMNGNGPDIPGSNVTVLNSSSLTALFALNSATPGVRNLVVTNPDGTSASLPNAFTIQPGGGPQLWANLFGRNKIRIGAPQTFYIAFGNYGNTDSLGAQLLVYVPSTLSPNFTFGNANGVVSSVTQGPTTVLTVNVGRVPAGSTSLIPITLIASPTQAPFQVQVQVSGH